MQELEYITFIIPLRVDSEERRTNLDAVLNYFCKYKEVKIMVLEADTELRYQPRIEHPGFTCQFVEDHNPIFYRTRYLNRMLREVRTPVAGIWDSDAIVRMEQVAEAVKHCMTGSVLCYPYDGRYYYVSPYFSRLYKETGDFDVLVKNESLYGLPAGFYAVGGAFTIQVEKYLSAGGENENFYGWGPEDTERRERITTLSLPVSRTSGCLYHLCHPRGFNSEYANEERAVANLREYLKICRMNRKELEDYILTWPWMNKELRTKS